MLCLLMPIAAPMQSWGDTVVSGDDRPTLPFPTHSGLGGLICAALGIDRHDEAGLRQVHDHLRFIILAVSGGKPQRDYYSVENIARAGGSGGGSIVGSKYYLADAVFLAAASLLPDSPVSLEEIGRAILNPHYALYAGRRAYPLSLPPVCHENGVPRIWDLEEPFEKMVSLVRDESQRRRIFSGHPVSFKDPGDMVFYCDAEDPALSGLSGQPPSIPYSVRDRYHGRYRSWGYRSFDIRDVRPVPLKSKSEV